MIAKAIFAKNYEEIQEAKRLELRLPDPVFESDTFGFYLDDVARFHKTDNGNIKIYFFDGADWTIEYQDILWNKLLEMFKE